MAESTYDFLGSSHGEPQESQLCQTEPAFYSSLFRRDGDGEGSLLSDDQAHPRTGCGNPEEIEPRLEGIPEATQVKQRTHSAEERDFKAASGFLRQDTFPEQTRQRASSFGATVISREGRQQGSGRRNSWLRNPFDLGGILYPVAELIQGPRIEIDEPSFIDKGLYLGSYYAVQQKDRLQRRRVASILTVASGLPPVFPHSFKYTIIEVWDTTDTDLKQHFDVCFEAIDQGRAKGGVVVHCAAGVSRSATVVIAYLMKTKNVSLAQAIAHVKRRRHIIHPNAGFMQQLKMYERELQDITK